MVGRGSDDTLYGDTAVFSYQGNDILIGGSGRDILEGGPATIPSTRKTVKPTRSTAVVVPIG